MTVQDPPLPGLVHAGSARPTLLKRHVLRRVTPSFPPTVLVKAMADVLVDPAQTSDVYNRLKDVGVETKLIEARDMLHGDVEGENDMLDHPKREKYFWKEVYNVALDWCIERTRGEGERTTAGGESATGEVIPMRNGEMAEDRPTVGLDGA